MRYNYRVVGHIDGDIVSFGVKAPYIVNALMQAGSMIHRIREIEHEVYAHDAPVTLLGIVMSDEKDMTYHTCNDVDFKYNLCADEHCIMCVEEHEPIDNGEGK